MFAVARAARVCGGAFVAVTGLAVGQAVLHEASYTPLPERRFRTTGLELPAFARQKREELLAQHELLKQKRDALSALAVLRQAELRERLRELRETQPLESLRRKAVEHAKDRWRTLLDTFAPRGECDGEDFSGVLVSSAPCAAPPYRVLFVGDSLVTGVGAGAESAAAHGPPLPRRVCRALADLLGVQVEWRALGLTGGAIAEIRARLVPKISAAAGGYDVVVIMCGLNDFKYLARGELRTPWAFGSELDKLVAEIRAEVGDHCRIVLPALPVSLSAFREPLKSYVIFLARKWDEQKEALAIKMSGARSHSVQFIGVLQKPPAPNAVQLLIAADGVHPNEQGYELWAQHIARALVGASKDGC